MSKIIAIILTSALAFSVTAFIVLASPESCNALKGGAEIEAVEVALQESKVPSLQFATAAEGSSVKSPLASIESGQRKIIREGEGQTYTGDQLLTIEYAVFSSTTGNQLVASNWDGTDSASQVFNSTTDRQFCDALSGVAEGSVVAFALPTTEGDPEGSLYILELKKVYLPHAIGSGNPPESGMPAVVLTPKTGQPGLVQPSFSAPTEFKRSTLISGDGEVLKIGDSVTVHYVGWVWTDDMGDPFDSSWLQSDPQTPASPKTFTLDEANLIPGFVKALDGIAVGSQVIAVMPPSDAYGEAGQGPIPANATLIFVIDVLGINK